ncbi:MAG TPA: glycosyltransferase family 4 protein [Bryobacteraceae bacterium]|nr:glycosyltransferase family 4 protein [Bryobacteraceae bacterium]
MTNSALFLSPESPYPLHGGGALRSASLLNFLAGHAAVDLIAFRDPRADDPRRHIPAGLVRDLRVIDLPAHARHPLARAARNTGRLLRGVPPLLDRFAGFGPQVAEAVRGRRYDIAVIEHFWCAPYWTQLAAVSEATVLDLHNVESVLHERCALTESGPQAVAHRSFRNASRKMEQEWLPRFTYLLAASAEDAAALTSISPGSSVSVYPNALPLVPAPQRTEEDVIVFSGNLEYHPNVSAVRYFHRRIWPLLREQWPGLVWRLIGRNPRAIAGIVRGDGRIDVRGPVDDALPELARAKIAIVPILAGSGTRFKIIEAWAAGVPVVSTSIGAEGLPVRAGEHLLLADQPEEFAAAVSLLLKDASLRGRIGRAGRYLYECEFNWKTAWKGLHFFYPATMVRSDALRD